MLTSFYRIEMKKQDNKWEVIDAKMDIALQVSYSWIE